MMETQNSNEAEDSDELTYIHVIVGEERIPFKCQRKLLSEHCKYFKALFDFPDGDKLTSTALDNICPYAFEQLLDMIKNPKDVKCQPKNFNPISSLLEIIKAAIFLVCPEAEEICTDKMLDLETMNEGDVLPYMIYAHMNGCKRLKKGAEDYFRTMYRTLEHPNVFQDPMGILGKRFDDFEVVLGTVKNNGLALYLILGWVHFDESARVHHIEGLIDKYVIRELLSERDFVCFDTKMNHFDVSILDRIGGNLSNNDLTKRTWPLLTILLTNSSDSTDYEDSANGKQGMWIHELLNNNFTWKRIVPFVNKEWAESNWSVCISGHTMYFLGGESADVWTFDLAATHPDWEQLPTKMPQARISPAVATFEEKIYLFGGLPKESRGYFDPLTDGKEFLVYDSADCYDIKTGTWQSISSLPGGEMFGGKAFEYERKIYIVGGRAFKRIYSASQAWLPDQGPMRPDERVLPVLRGIWAYDPACDRYELVTYIPEECSSGDVGIGYGIVVVGSIMYLIGGSGYLACNFRGMRKCKCAVHSTVIGFDLSKRIWIMDLPQLIYPRTATSCFYDGHTIQVRITRLR